MHIYEGNDCRVECVDYDHHLDQYLQEDRLKGEFLCVCPHGDIEV